MKQNNFFILIFGVLFLLVGCSSVPFSLQEPFHARVYYLYNYPYQIPSNLDSKVDSMIDSNSDILKTYKGQVFDYELYKVQMDSVDFYSFTVNQLMDTSNRMKLINIFCELSVRTNFDEDFLNYDTDIFILADTIGAGFLYHDSVQFLSEDIVIFGYKYGNRIDYINNHEFLHQFGCIDEPGSECFMFKWINETRPYPSIITYESLCGCRDEAYKDEFNLRLQQSARGVAGGMVCMYNETWHMVEG